MLWLAWPYGTPTFKVYMSMILPDPTFKAYIGMILLDRTGPYLWSIHDYDLANLTGPLPSKHTWVWSCPTVRDPTFEAFMSIILPDRTGPYLWSIHEYALARPYGNLSLKHSWVWSYPTLWDPYLRWVWSCLTIQTPISIIRILSLLIIFSQRARSFITHIK